MASFREKVFLEKKVVPTTTFFSKAGHTHKTNVYVFKKLVSSNRPKVNTHFGYGQSSGK